jgi:hypothetical protein
MGLIQVTERDNIVIVTVVGSKKTTHAKGSLTASTGTLNGTVSLYDNYANFYIARNHPFASYIDSSRSAYGNSSANTVTALNGIVNATPEVFIKDSNTIADLTGISSGDFDNTKGNRFVVATGTNEGISTQSTVALNGSGDVVLASNVLVTGNITVSGTVDGVDVAASVYDDSDADARIEAASIEDLSDVPTMGTSGQVLAVNSTEDELEYVTVSSGGLGNIVEDTSPQLGGNLDVNSNKITSTTAGEVLIEPDGSGVTRIANPNGNTTVLKLGGNTNSGGSVHLDFKHHTAANNAGASIRSTGGSYGTGSLSFYAKGTNTSDGANLVGDNLIARMSYNNGLQVYKNFSVLGGDLQFGHVGDNTSAEKRLGVKGDEPNSTQSSLHLEAGSATYSGRGGGHLRLKAGAGAGSADSGVISFWSCEGILSSGTNTNLERMRISPEGYLGIGTTSPTEKLHVTGQIKVDDGSNPFTLPASDGSANQVLQTDGSGAVTWATVSGGTNLANTDLTATNNRTYDQSGNDLIIDPNGGIFEINDSSGSPSGPEVSVGQGQVEIDTVSGGMTMNGIVYPDSDGTNGQVLTTNGSGALSFATNVSFPGLGTTNTTALAGDTTTITSTQASAITANTAKVGITSTQASDITANNAKTGITSAQASAIAANTAKVGITSSQASAITANTAKTGITSTQASDITANNAKTGITSGQASAITANTAKISYTDASAVAANTAKTGITSQQASDITANNAKVSYTDASAVAANTAKVGITTQQASDITTNNAKVGITTAQANAITANTAKTDTHLGNSNLTAALDIEYDQDGNDLVFDPNGGTFQINDSSGLPGAAEIQIGQGNVDIAGTQVSINSIDYPTVDGSSGQVITTNGSGSLSFTTVSGGGGLGSADQTLTADRTIDTNGFNLDIELDSSGTADTFTIHDGTHDLFQVDTSTSGTIFSVNDVSGLPKFTVDDSEGVTIDKFKEVKYEKPSNTDFSYQGDVVYFGTTTGMTQGDLYYYNSSGAWAQADADAASTSGGVLLAIALGAASDVNGMLLKGTFTMASGAIDGTEATGDELYVGTTAGHIASDVSAYTTSDVVRVVGYMLDGTNGQIWFNPSNDFIELA